MLLPSNTDEALEATKAVLVDRIFGEAGKELVIEDFLEGEEVSLLAFCDGRVSVCMPAAQVWVSCRVIISTYACRAYFI